VDKIRPGSSPGFGTNIKLMMGNREMILIPHSFLNRCPESPVASPAADNGEKQELSFLFNSH
jgi:hypothetical protein